MVESKSKDEIRREKRKAKKALIAYATKQRQIEARRKPEKKAPVDKTLAQKFNLPVIFVDQNGTEIALNLEKHIAKGKGYVNPYFQRELDKIVKYRKESFKTKAEPIYSDAIDIPATEWSIT